MTSHQPQDGIRLAFVTAFPPETRSLNEFGFHMVRHMVANDGVSALQILADKADDESSATSFDPATLGRDSALEDTDFTVDQVWSFNHPMTALHLIKAIRKAKPDAVLFNLQFATFGDQRVPGALGLLTPALVSLLGTPTGVILHNLVDNVDMQDAGFTNSKVMATIMNRIGRALTRILLRSDYVALTIPRYVEFVRDSYGAKNVLLTPHGSFDETPAPGFGIPEGKTRKIMTFGKFGTYKKVDVLIDAYRDLLSRGFDDIELVIAGTDSPNSPGYLDSVAESCQDLPNVTFTGYVAEEDVPRIFAESAVVAFPYTSTTGSSGVLHQAGEYGRAVALPAIGDFVEVIEEEGFVGQYFEPGDATSLADAMAKLLDDNELNVAQGRRNHRAAVGIPMSEVVDWHLLHLDRIRLDRFGPTALLGSKP